MSISKPYYHIWRPVHDYDISCILEKRDNTEYLYDKRYVNPEEFRSLANAARLQTTDLNKLFMYIEPTEANLSVYSQKIFELFVRASIEFEANCKVILKANQYHNSGNWNINDYNKINDATKLSDYIVHFNECAIPDIRPFKEWQSQNPLSWYQDYNSVKHNRSEFFSKANLSNLFKAVAGLYCILHAQFGHRIASYISNNGMASICSDESIIENDFVVIQTPLFTDEERYEFDWATLKENDCAFDFYSFR